MFKGDTIMICKTCGSQADICFCQKRVDTFTSGGVERLEESTTLQELEQRVQRLEERCDALARLERSSHSVTSPLP